MTDGIDLRFRRSNQTFGTSLSFENDILSLLNNRGDVLSSVNIDLIKKEELPTANEDNLGVIYLYTGPDDEYKHGYFYECVENSGTYSWENIIVQDSYLKNESDDRFVHKKGDETISDIKTFIGKSAQDPLEAHMIIKNLKDDFRYSDGTKFYYISFRDKNNKECGYMGYNHTDKSSFIELGARKTPKGSLVTTLEVGFDDDGNAYTYAPKPTEDTTTSSQLDTVGARNTKLQNYQEKETAINYNNISNCITEIPQDIKLELNNGTLTLKAGSKVYVPNGKNTDGSNKFDEVIVPGDLQTTTVINEKLFIFVQKDGSGLDVLAVANCGSGASPTPTSYSVKYDTTTNLCKLYTTNLTVQDRDVSFPVAICQGSSSGFTSIDQVFNGFGYIGSTVYALPGVKGLIPNGRNEDGSLKSVELTNTVLRTVNLTGTGDMVLVIATTGVGINFYAYDSVKNAIYRTDTGAYYNADRFIAGNVSFANNVITSLTPKTPFHAVDYNDKSTISGWAMPSSKYISLTLGADGATYTAPANGFLVLNKASTSSGQHVMVQNASKGLGSSSYSSSSGQFLISTCLGQKGDIFTVRYTAEGITSLFRFIYAEGEI